MANARRFIVGVRSALAIARYCWIACYRRCVLVLGGCRLVLVVVHGAGTWELASREAKDETHPLTGHRAPLTPHRGTIMAVHNYHECKVVTR